MMKEKFTNRESYEEALEAVYKFHRWAYMTVLSLLRRKGDAVLTRGIKFDFISMEGSYEVRAVRLTDDGKDFYLDCTSESGDDYAIDWEQINHDMIITEWLVGLRFPVTYPAYNYKTIKWEMKTKNDYETEEIDR